jgi:hypothetical protein
MLLDVHLLIDKFTGRVGSVLLLGLVVMKLFSDVIRDS